MKLNGLEKYFNTVNGEIVDFEQFNDKGWSPLMFSLENNKRENLNLNEKQFNYLFKKSDLNKFNLGLIPLMFCFAYNKEQNLNLNEKQWNYIIKKSQLKDKDFLYPPLMYALNYNDKQDLKLNSNQWKYLIDNSNISLIKSEEYLNKLKKINLMLLNDDILNKINIAEKNNKKVKI